MSQHYDSNTNRTRLYGKDGYSVDAGPSSYNQAADQRSSEFANDVGELIARILWYVLKLVFYWIPKGVFLSIRGAFRLVKR